MNMQAGREAELYGQEDVQFCIALCCVGRPAGRRLFTVLVCRQATGRTTRQAKGLHGQHAGGCTYTRQEGGCAFLNLHVDGEPLEF
jgi:hypothetical protein